MKEKVGGGIDDAEYRMEEGEREVPGRRYEGGKSIRGGQAYTVIRSRKVT